MIFESVIAVRPLLVNLPDGFAGAPAPCHPERSEGSRLACPTEPTRSLAALGMTRCPRIALRRLPQQPPQHVLEDAAVAVILDLHAAVDTHDRLELDLRAVLAPRLHGHALA